MGYIYTFGDDPIVYYLPMAEIERIMSIINTPDIASVPKHIDMRKYWYGREATSMIRGAKECKTNEWEVHRILMQLPETTKEQVSIFIETRRKKMLPVTSAILRQYISEIS